VNLLCLTTNLSSSELASWVQAVGSIAAVIGAAFVAWYQTSRQFKNELKLQRVQLAAQRAESARTLLKLAQSSSHALTYVTEKLPDRESIQRAADGLSSCGIGEIDRLDAHLRALPLHELPDTLITPALMMGSVVRQFKDKVEMALRLHRQMNAENFADFFGTMKQMNESVKETCADIETEVCANAA
jgi:hypothetical protein